MSYKFVEGDSYVKALLSKPGDAPRSAPFVPPVKRMEMKTKKQETHGGGGDNFEEKNNGDDEFDFDDGRRWYPKGEAEKVKEQRRLRDEKLEKQYERKMHKIKSFPRTEEDEVKSIREFILGQTSRHLDDLVREMNMNLEKDFSTRATELHDKMVNLNNDEDDKIKKKAKEEIAKNKKKRRNRWKERKRMKSLMKKKKLSKLLNVLIRMGSLLRKKLLSRRMIKEIKLKVKL